MKKIRRFLIKYTTLIGYMFFKTGTTSMGMDIPTAYGMPAPSNPRTNLPWIILVIVGVLVVIPTIIIVGIIAYNKKKTQNQENSNKHE